jgi:hypothetical protein
MLLIWTRMELANLIAQRHELVKLAALIDWSAFVEAWGPTFRECDGAPGAGQAADGRAAVPQARLRAVG